VELAPRRVTIHEAKVVDWDDTDTARPIATAHVRCSAGTYVRALARDLGERLGSAAYLCALVRTASGPFRLEEAHSLDEIRDAAATDGPEGVRRLLLPVDAGLDAIPAIALTDTEIADAAQGRFVRPAAGVLAAPDGVAVRLVDGQGTIVGLGRREGARVAPTKILQR
jgi:tRNA pseudouridine55 synthase